MKFDQGQNPFTGPIFFWLNVLPDEIIGSVWRKRRPRNPETLHLKYVAKQNQNTESKTVTDAQLCVVQAPAM